MGLTNLQIKNAKPKDKDYKLYDGNGLFLLVTKAGGKYWKMRFKYQGKEKKLSIGDYPAMTITEARDAVQQHRNSLRSGDIPTSQRVSQQTILFRELANQWWQERNTTMDAKTQKNTRYRLDKHILPRLGDMQPSHITTRDIVDMGLAIQKSGAASVGGRCISIVRQIMRPYCIKHNIPNPTSDASSALSPHQEKQNPHLEAHELREFYCAMRALPETISTIAADFLLHTMTRTGEIRGATMGEIDREEKVWRIPAERMKKRRPHMVPLNDYTLELIDRANIYNEDNRIFPISENAVLDVIKRLGWKGRITGHGFRSTASTILHDHGFATDHIEMQLAHTMRGVRGVYNRAEYLQDRRTMLEWWTEYLQQQNNQ